MTNSIYSGLADSALRNLEERKRLRRKPGELAAKALGVVTLVCVVLGTAYSLSMLAFVLDGGGDAAATRSADAECPGTLAQFDRWFASENAWRKCHREAAVA